MTWAGAIHASAVKEPTTVFEPLTPAGVGGADLTDSRNIVRPAVARVGIGVTAPLPAIRPFAARTFAVCSAASPRGAPSPMRRVRHRHTMLLIGTIEESLASLSDQSAAASSQS
jgi:hypothetical protein